MSDFAADLFAGVASAESPQRALAEMSNKELELLIEGLRRLDKPNDFQAQVFAMAMMRVLERWKNSIRI